MQNKPNIRWRKTDIEKLTKKIKYFNAKISRIEKNHPDLIGILPKRINRKQLMDNIQYRNTFNREIRSMDRFLKRGSETPVENKQGIKVTKWERKETAIKYATWNRKLSQERKKQELQEVTSQGKPTGLKRGEMGSVRMKSLSPRKFDFEKVKSKKEWDKLVARVEKNLLDTNDKDKMEMFKMNYIKGIYRVFGEHGEDIARKLKQLPASVIVDMFYKEQEASIDFIYDPIEMIARLDTIENIWNDYIEDNEGMTDRDNWSVENETEMSEWLESGW